MLGTILGDICGSLYEGSFCPRENFELYPLTGFFTDDTVCTMAVMEAFSRNRNVEQTLRDWYSRYPNAGYSSAFQAWVTDGKPNSDGNGAAMRTAPLAWLGHPLNKTLAIAERVAKATHSGDEAVKGAKIVTELVWRAKAGQSVEVLAEAAGAIYELRGVEWYAQNRSKSHKAIDTIPVALSCALESNGFEQAIENALYAGGDTDTIAAIAGGIAEALHGLPKGWERFIVTKLDDSMVDIVSSFYSKFDKKGA